MGPLPGGDHDLGPTLGDDEPSVRERTVRLGAGETAGGRPEEDAFDAPRPPGAGDGPGERHFRRLPPPAASGRRAFLTGLLGVAGMAAAGAVAARAWYGRDWLAFVTGDPFEVRVTRRRALTGRAGPLYVVEGTIRNLSGSPKGFFEVRARLLDAAGQTLAERVVFAGQVLRDAELRGLPRTDLESRVAETVFGEGMANARVQPRRTVPFQVVFVEPPPTRRIADAAAEVVGVKDVP